MRPVLSSVVDLPRKLNTAEIVGCGPSPEVEHTNDYHGLTCTLQRDDMRQLFVGWWTLGIFTWGEGTPPVHQHMLCGQVPRGSNQRFCHTIGQPVHRNASVLCDLTPGMGVCSVGIVQLLVRINTRTVLHICLQ